MPSAVVNEAKRVRDLFRLVFDLVLDEATAFPAEAA